MTYAIDVVAGVDINIQGENTVTFSYREVFSVNWCRFNGAPDVNQFLKNSNYSLYSKYSTAGKSNCLSKSLFSSRNRAPKHIMRYFYRTCIFCK